MVNITLIEEGYLKRNDSIALSVFGITRASVPCYEKAGSAGNRQNPTMLEVLILFKENLLILLIRK